MPIGTAPLYASLAAPPCACPFEYMFCVRLYIPMFAWSAGAMIILSPTSAAPLNLLSCGANIGPVLKVSSSGSKIPMLSASLGAKMIFSARSYCFSASPNGGPVSYISVFSAVVRSSSVTANPAMWPSQKLPIELSATLAPRCHATPLRSILMSTPDSVSQSESFI